MGWGLGRRGMRKSTLSTHPECQQWHARTVRKVRLHVSGEVYGLRYVNCNIKHMYVHVLLHTMYSETL